MVTMDFVIENSGVNIVKTYRIFSSFYLKIVNRLRNEYLIKLIFTLEAFKYLPLWSTW